MKNPLVSIIIATYNEEEHIANCINSLLKQSYRPIEIIITDDGSIDKTIEIIQEFVLRYNNVKLLKQKRKGMAFGWNKSFTKSKGEIIMMFGADMVASKDLIKDLATPIINKECIGTAPIEEEILNKDNIWARAKGKKRLYSDTVYLALTRDAWVKSGGADTRKGYSADQSFYEYLKVKPKQVKTKIYDNHPASFIESWKQNIWIGSSFEKPYLYLLAFLLFPLMVIYKSIKGILKDPYIPFILFLPFYHTLKYVAYFIGVLRKIFLGKNYRG